MRNIINLEKRIASCVSNNKKKPDEQYIEQEELQRDILSLEVESFDDLEIKTRIIDEIVKSEAKYASLHFSSHKMLKTLIHDIMMAYANEKSKFDGSYGRKAHSGYFNLFYPSSNTVNKK